MLANEIVNTQWSIYINGWFQHNQIVFLEGGKVDGCGTEGFATWLYSNNHLVIADELGKVNYKLAYIESANIWISVSEYRNSNNNILLASVVSDDEQSYSPIANRSAIYKSPKGQVWGYLFFGIDGKIYNYHNNNESFWKIEDKKLLILNDNMEKSLESELMSGSEEYLSLVMKQVYGNSNHHLVFTENHNKNHSLNQLKLDISLSNKNNILFVIFNSAGEEYNSDKVNFELFNLPNSYNADYIRIAQSSPSRWYLDDMELIKQLVFSREYKKVVCIGMSMGGYAAVWLSETLASIKKETRFYSIAIQLLSSIEPEYLKFYKQTNSDEQRSKTPDFNIVSEYQKKNIPLNIKQMLSENKNNILHHVIYDALNESEIAGVEELKSNRVKILSIPYGTDHADGCYKIYHDGVVNKLLDKIIWSS